MHKRKLLALAMTAAMLVNGGAVTALADSVSEVDPAEILVEASEEAVEEAEDTASEEAAEAAPAEASAEIAVTEEAPVEIAVTEEVPAEEAIPVGSEENSGYVLMNIPYADFYAAEGVENVDAVTSATKNKTRTGTLAGGSYHVNADGTDITGITYPVFVEDTAALADCKEIKDTDSVEITVTNRGNTTTTTYEGKDALFEAPSYSYYTLAEKPARYKKLSTADGKFTFGAVSGRAAKVEGVTGSVSLTGHHTDVEIKLSGTEGIAQGDKVSAVVLTDSDGKMYGMRHVYNIWRATELGWDEEELDMLGKTITNIRYITESTVIDFPVDLKIAALLLDKTSANVKPGETLTLTASMSPAADPAPAITWESSDETVATVDNGTVTALKSGNVVISAKTEDGYEASCSVRVLFADVTNADDFFYNPVYWAVQQGVTNGKSATAFEPKSECKRSEVVTFLWRAAGSPEPKSTENPFKDVAEGKFYYKAVLWAIENNITTGAQPDAFEPDATCTRGQVVTFLHRAAGSPKAEATETAFTDVPADKYYYTPVLWAVGKSITSGTSTTTFTPNGTCTRAQIVTFLYRNAGSPRVR